MPLTSVGVDGVTTVIPGWTNQSTTPYSSGLESYGSAGSYSLNVPARYGFLGWNMSPVEGTTTSFTIGTTLTNYLFKIFVPTNGTSTKAACIPHTNVANISAFYMALYSYDLQTKLAVTAESHTAIGTSGNDVVYEPSWAASVGVVGNTFYYVEMTVGWATGAPTFSGCAASQSAAALNAGLTAATSFSASNGTAATPPANYTAGSNTALASAPWVAIL